MTYNTAKEFADIIKKEFYEYEQEADDKERRHAVVKRQYERIATIPIPDDFLFQREFDAINTKFQEVINNIITRFYSIIPQAIKARFENHFYFTTIDNKSIRAHIRRSPDKRFFGVFINSSVISLLTKIGKLDAALMNPNCIVYCNRFPYSKPTFEDIKVMRSEMFAYFMTFKMSHGPYLIIEGQEATAHFTKLDIQEQFIIYHEIAHFLNGDLFADATNQKLTAPFINLNHQREHLADLLAFAILLKSERGKIESSKEYYLFILSSIIHLFDIFSGLQQQEENSHPHPLNRMNAIVECYFGVELADLIEKTYHDRNAWLEMLSYPIEMKFSLDVIEDMINRNLVEVFESSSWN